MLGGLVGPRLVLSRGLALRLVSRGRLALRVGLSLQARRRDEARSRQSLELGWVQLRAGLELLLLDHKLVLHRLLLDKLVGLQLRVGCPEKKHMSRMGFLLEICFCKDVQADAAQKS